MSPHHVAGLVLAGGQSSRMGVPNKPLLDLGGETMIARIVRRLKPQVAELAVNANGDPTPFAGLNCPILPDTLRDFPGPLAGVLSGLIWARAEGADRLLTVAGDGPFFPVGLCASLAGASDPSTIVVAACAGRAHPVFALWPAQLAQDLDRHLRNGGSRRVTSYLAMHQSVTVDFSLVELGNGERFDPFFNVNTPDDLAEARRVVQKLAT